MTITLTMAPQTQRKLVERATRVGQDVETLACELIERSLNSDKAVATSLGITTKFACSIPSILCYSSRILEGGFHVRVTRA